MDQRLNNTSRIDFDGEKTNNIFKTIYELKSNFIYCVL